MLTYQTQAQISPGPLHESHAFLEGLANCTKCHTAAAKSSPEKCLACHTLLQERIANKQGLHVHPEYQQCGVCHGDHYGRDFELIRWKNGRENFDHSLTGYELDGVHQELICRDCHQPAFIRQPSPLIAKEKDLIKTFLGLRKDCLSCHTDEHRGQFGLSCLPCHNMNGWKPVPGFDHDVTKFPLTGEHQLVNCDKCHTRQRDNRFPDDPSFLTFAVAEFERCNDCHQDPHRGQFGLNCESCHNTSGWSGVPAGRLNHDKTRFPLKGKHQFVQCNACHAPGKPHRGVKFANCSDCHADFHRGQFAASSSGGECQHCHSVNGFTPSTFTVADHQNTEYPLKGAHLAVPCLACHAGGPRGSRSPRSMLKLNRFTIQHAKCSDCHSDPHRGEVDKFTRIDGCQYCHSIESWRRITFNHSQTAFDLEGRHLEIECSDCHQPDKNEHAGKTLSFAQMPLRCIDCHQDVHLGQFIRDIETADGIQRFTDCARCHSAKNWRPDKFDHDRDARFPLAGKHAAVDCRSCHLLEAKSGRQVRRFRPIETACAACHGGIESSRQ